MSLDDAVRCSTTSLAGPSSRLELTERPSDIGNAPLTLPIVGTLAASAFGLPRWRRTGVVPADAARVPSAKS